MEVKEEIKGIEKEESDVGRDKVEKKLRYMDGVLSKFHKHKKTGLILVFPLQ